MMVESSEYIKRYPLKNSRDRIFQYFQDLGYGKTTIDENFEFLQEIDYLLLTNNQQQILILLDNIPETAYHDPEEFAKFFWRMPAARNFILVQHKKGIPTKLFWAIPRWQFQGLSYGIVQFILNEVQVILISATTLEFLPS